MDVGLLCVALAVIAAFVYYFKAPLKPVQKHVFLKPTEERGPLKLTEMRAATPQDAATVEDRSVSMNVDRGNDNSGYDFCHNIMALAKEVSDPKSTPDASKTNSSEP